MDPLPLGPTVQTSYQTVRDGFDRLLGAAALWLALLLLVDAIMRFVLAPDPAVPAAEVVTQATGEITAFVIENGALLLAIAAIAVAWHRQVLRGEPAGDGAAPLDKAVFRYLGMTFAIALLAALPIGLALSVLAQVVGGMGAGTQLMAMPLLALGALIWVRMNLVLPAAAIGDTQMTVRRSWDRTRGHGLKLLAGILMTSVPTALAAALVAAIVSHLVGDTPVLRALPRAILIAGNFLEAALVTTFLSLAYRRLWDEGRGAAVSA